jgi:hypothetical protein
MNIAASVSTGDLNDEIMIGVRFLLTTNEKGLRLSP